MCRYGCHSNPFAFSVHTVDVNVTAPTNSSLIGRFLSSMHIPGVCTYIVLHTDLHMLHIPLNIILSATDHVLCSALHILTFVHLFY